MTRARSSRAYADDIEEDKSSESLHRQQQPVAEAIGIRSARFSAKTCVLKNGMRISRPERVAVATRVYDYAAGDTRWRWSIKYEHEQLPTRFGRAALMF